MMPPHPLTLFKRKQTNNTSPTSVNANLITTNHNHIENNQQQTNMHSNRISTIQKKRYIWICITIATLFALRLLKVQNLKIEQTTIAQDILSNEKESSTNNDHQVVIVDAPPIQPRVKFIPYPHKTLGSGASVQCQWETRHIIPINDTSTTLLDFTQQSAYTEGICIPPTLNNTIHIFSSAEAIQCLSSEIQQRDIRVILSGDSYMKQLYIGLADILLSKHISDDKQMRDSKQRKKMLSTAQYWMKKRHETNATFPFVQYQCEDECYGKNSLDVCSQCISSFSENTTNKNRSNDDDVWVVGVGVHTYARAKRQVDIAVQHIQQFLNTEQEHNRTIYVSPPQYFHREDYPTQSINMERLYRGLLPHVAPENAAHPFLDVFELTQSCTMENCTYDGGHRSRYVNRWKAQLLLNMLCEVR